MESNVSDQLIAISNALLNGLQNLTLLKSRTLSIALSHTLQPLSNVANVDLPAFKQLMALNQIPRCASIKKPLARKRAHCDSVLALRSRASRASSLRH